MELQLHPEEYAYEDLYEDSVPKQAHEKQCSSIEQIAVKPKPTFLLSSCDWMDQANCKGCDISLFYWNDMNPRERQRAKKVAREICADCAVIKPCREWARVCRENGFWGGETEWERTLAGYPPKLPR